MPPVRFRIQTMMVIIAVSAVMMSLLRLAPSLFYLFLSLVLQVFLVLLIIAVIARLFAVYDWLIRGRRRRFSRGRSLIAASRSTPKRAAKDCSHVVRTLRAP